ncbi:MAG: transposase [Deltaproteobacteria bacterium]|jgi:galactokinase|nr:transposase [Deltaproteobacteria bacterium]
MAKFKRYDYSQKGDNGQAQVDDKHQIIVRAAAFGSGQDAKHLAPMVDGSKANMQKIGQHADYFKGKILTADANYHNQGNLKKCHDEQIDAYIPALKFRNRDSRFATRPRNKPKKGKKFVLEDFKHHKAADHYICPNGRGS